MAANSVAAAAYRAALIALLGVLPLAGCAFSIPIRPSLEGSRWQVRAIDGEVLPPTSNYQVQFGGGRIAGRLGCNRFGGLYWLGSESIVVHVVETSEMACDPATTAHEAAGLAALRQPLRIFWTDLGARLKLTSSTGSLDLRRLK